MSKFTSPPLSFKYLARFYLLFARKIQASFYSIHPHRFILSCALLSCGKDFRPGCSIEILNPGQISIGVGFSTGKNVRIHAWTSYQGLRISHRNSILIKIGDHVSMNDNSYITSACSISIGDNCLLGSNVLITDNSHGNTDLTSSPRITLPLETKGPVVIGSNVWICNNVVITSGLCIGDNSIIAANSVVTCDVPEGTLFGGVPARCLKVL
jgi:lipopolysaccharide O-acetyltransferase